MRRKRRTPAEQLRLITECYQSGFTVFRWCQQNDVKISTFYAWINRLRQRGEIDIPAVIPTVMPWRPEQPDIVQVNVEGEKPLPLTKSGTGIPVDSEESLLSATSLQTGSPKSHSLFLFSGRQWTRSSDA